MGVTRAVPACDARWLDALQRLASRAAHELKGALNGVSVNLEVVRSRALRVDASASAVASFAEAASNQLDEVIALTDALLGLARQAREPVEIGIEARRIIILLSAAVRADGRRLTIEEAAYGALGVTSAPGSAVRLAICECLLAAVNAGADIHCSATGESNRATMRIEVGGGATLAVDDDATVAAADAGVHIQAERSAISIGFPR